MTQQTVHGILSVLQVILSIIIGTVIFSKGFLLSRVVVKENSSCEGNHSSVSSEDIRASRLLNFKHKLPPNCWPIKHYNKSIILVIDALRYDFLSHNDDQSPRYYHNRLPVISELLRSEPWNTALYKFIADPPTTTLQRLKGLTTGSLPTFVDAGSNFATPEINEDNIIDQQVRNAQHVVLLGDDTWMGLFPNRFFKSFAFPSFNVQDLHSVDNGVLANLIPTLKSNDWHMVIAHFLGVDHCGHRYGPNHPAMSDKLKQMNDMIRSVLEIVDNDTVVFVLGDHGMTSTGDHGGDSRDELEAGLFVYSKQRLRATQDSQQDTVRQTDIVPTISLLLGNPIPFSNLGKVIVDLLPVCQHCLTSQPSPDQLFYSVYALRHNAQQITRFLDKYVTLSADIPQNVYHERKRRFDTMETEFAAICGLLENDAHEDGLTPRLADLQRAYSDYMDEIRTICASVWAKFDVPLMILGIVTIASAVLIAIKLFIVGFKYGIAHKHYRTVIGQFIVAVISAVTIFFGYLSTYSIVYCLCFATVHTGLIGYMYSGRYKFTSLKRGSVVPQSFDECTAIIVVFLLCASQFSNSFVVYRDIATSYLLQTLVLTKLLNMLRLHLRDSFLYRKKYTKTRAKFDLLSVMTRPVSISICACVALAFCVRMMQYFFVCREEQIGCTTVETTQPLANLIAISSRSRNFHYFFNVLALVVLIALPYSWLRYHGNLNGNGIFQGCVKNCLPVSAVSIALYWALQALPSTTLDSLPAWQHVTFPRITFVLSAVSLISHFFSPVSVFIVDRKQASKRIETMNGATTIPAMFQHLKRVYNEESNESADIPLAYGAGSVYSASLVFVGGAVCVLMSLLVGEGPAASLPLLILAIYLLLEIHAYITNITKATEVPLSIVVMWSLLARLSFHATAHQTSFQTIRWEAAYVGFHGDHVTNAIPAVLLLANTYAAYIIAMVTLPLLVTWPRVRAFRRGEAEGGEGDFHLYKKPQDLWSQLTRLALGQVIIQATQLLATMCAAAVLRRHLMVWKVFAQVFIFEAIATIVVFATLTLTLLFVARLDRCVHNWVITKSIQL